MDAPIYLNHIVGYTGHIPSVHKEEEINHIIHTKHIPGYAGYIPSICSENKFGESYGKETAKSLKGEIPKGADVPSYVRYTSTAREAFINQRAVKTQSTAELLGISSRKDYYKKPIPVDTFATPVPSISKDNAISVSLVLLTKSALRSFFNSILIPHPIIYSI